MKKIAIAALFSLGLANMASASDNFTGWFVGGEINSTKQEFSIPYSELGYHQIQGNLTATSSRQLGIAILGGYGFDFAGDFVGQIEGKIRSGGTKTKAYGETVSKEDFSMSVAYLQGYRISPQMLPYIKVGVSGSSFTMNNDITANSNYKFEDSGAVGIGYGLGFKYAITPDVELGVEYYKANLKAKNNIKFKSDTVAVNAVYRF